MKKNILPLLFVAASFGLSAQSMTPKDIQFAMDAGKCNLFEIKLAELCISNAGASSIKNLGTMMVTDHTKSYNELKAIGVDKNFTLPVTLDADQQRVYDNLAKKKGVAFDKTYSHLLVTEHEKAIAKFKNESKNGSDEDLTTWASVTLPVLENHLVVANDADLNQNKK